MKPDQSLVKPNFDIHSKVCVVSYPRPTNATGKTYRVDCLGNVVGGKRTIYNNQPIDVLMEVTATNKQFGSVAKLENTWHQKKVFLILRFMSTTWSLIQVLT